jgi:hypothetical protein
MSLWDIIAQILGAVGGGKPPSVSKEAPPPAPPAPPPPPPADPQTPVVTLSDRPGSFILPDIYPNDLGPTPPFSVLPNLQVDGGGKGGVHEVVGCYIKASEGTGWSGEQWFLQNFPRLTRLASPEFFPGAYHFLRFSVSGAAQADYFCNLVDRAGGLGEWGLMPWVDAEEGGQGNWAPGKLANLDHATKTKLAKDVRTCLTDYIKRVKERWPGVRVGLYGRGLFRDLEMTDCHFGQDAVCNPAYTSYMPPMDKYGISLKEITEWQLCGDGEVYMPGYPHVIPGWGKTDYSVAVDENRPTTLGTVRRRCLARPR